MLSRCGITMAGLCATSSPSSSAALYSSHTLQSALRGVHSSSAAQVGTGLGGGGKPPSHDPGREDPVKEMGEALHKVGEALTGNSTVAKDLLGKAKDAATWAVNSAKDTAAYATTNVAQVFENVKLDVQRPADPAAEANKDIPNTGPWSKGSKILERDYTSKDHPRTGAESIEPRLGGQPAGGQTRMRE